MQEIRVRLTGTRPLLMHSARTIDPMDPFVRAMKRITSKQAKQKTDEDLLELQRLEWLAGAYTDDHDDPENGRPILTEDHALATLVAGAKRSRNGSKVKRAVLATAEPFSHLKYKGPKKLGELYEIQDFRDCRPVGVNNKSVMRTRPKFRDWSVEFGYLLDEQEMDPADVIHALEEAGKYVGMCDFRPRYGRFEVEVLS